MPCQATFKEHCQYPKCDCDDVHERAKMYNTVLRTYDAHECQCTNPVHGGKLWKCNTKECLR